MNQALQEAFRHHTWATKHLLIFCQGDAGRFFASRHAEATEVPPGGLSIEQLMASTTGTHGNILDTFGHIIHSDAAYLRALGGGNPGWSSNENPVDLEELEARVDDLAQQWERLLAEPVDTERRVVVNQGAEEVRAGLFDGGLASR
jgi:hypothetical protein